MARADRVQGIRPKAGLRENATLIIAARLEELLSWRRALADASLVTDLHNMRIAGKRLRYALEIFEPCFTDGKKLSKELTDLQEELGTIHDLDVFIEVLRSRLRAMDASLDGDVLEIMGAEAPGDERTERVREFLAARAADQRRIGLLALIGDKTTERSKRYAAIQEHWGGNRLAEFEARTLDAVRVP